MGYDMIIGRDLLKDLDMDIKLSSQTIHWDFAEILMRAKNSSLAYLYHINDSQLVQIELKKAAVIMDAKYESAHLEN